MTRVATPTRSRSRAVSEDYLKLVRRFPLRPLRTVRDYDEASKVLDELVLCDDLSRGEADYLDALTRFVEDYDDAHHPLSEFQATPLEVLRHLVEHSDMTTTDLGRVIGSKGVASEILRGKRELSKTHIKLLSAHFKISPAILL
ncbi:MAG: hypothetical protein WBD40_22225 [Tepidisphaeraceae bacterium]